MSALDLFASAMGAFILVAIILFPFYMNEQTSAEQLAELEATLASQAETIAELQQQNSAQQADIEQLERQLKQSFLVVALFWNTDDQDVDLHVIDPQGREFYFEKHNRDGTDYPTSDAFLTVDSRKGPGTEVWLAPETEPGCYRIYGNLYERHNNLKNPQVPVKIFSRDDPFSLPTKTLTQVRQKILLGEVTVGANGAVRQGCTPG